MRNTLGQSPYALSSPLKLSGWYLTTNAPNANRPPSATGSFLLYCHLLPVLPLLASLCPPSFDPRASKSCPAHSAASSLCLNRALMSMICCINAATCSFISCHLRKRKTHLVNSSRSSSPFLPLTPNSFFRSEFSFDLWLEAHPAVPIPKHAQPRQMTLLFSAFFDLVKTLTVMT